MCSSDLIFIAAMSFSSWSILDGLWSRITPVQAQPLFHQPMKVLILIVRVLRLLLYNRRQLLFKRSQAIAQLYRTYASNLIFLNPALTCLALITVLTEYNGRSVSTEPNWTILNLKMGLICVPYYYWFGLLDLGSFTIFILFKLSITKLYNQFQNIINQYANENLLWLNS